MRAATASYRIGTLRRGLLANDGCHRFDLGDRLVGIDGTNLDKRARSRPSQIGQLPARVSCNRDAACRRWDDSYLGGFAYRSGSGAGRPLNLRWFQRYCSGQTRMKSSSTRARRPVSALSSSVGKPASGAWKRTS